MALFEMWCSVCNEVHGADSTDTMTTKKSILPGTKIWIRKPELPEELARLKLKASSRGLSRKHMSMRKIGKVKEDDGDNKTHDTSKWMLVPVLSRCGDHITVQIYNGFNVIDLETAKNCLPANHETVDDMTELHYAHNPAILYNIKARALRKVPYTFIGNVLVSVNPLREVDSQYSFEDGEMPPHPRTVAERAFQKMLFASMQRRRLQDLDDLQRRETKEKLAPRNSSLVNKNSDFAKQFGLVNQSILISGESGSGKTETAKRVLSQLVEREGYGYDLDYEDNENIFAFQENLIGTDPILESFGNAKTKRNPNSSRFGKFLKLMYQPGMDDDGYESQCFLYSASITTYLLERSRVTFQDEDEGNFRIFYQILSTPNIKIRKHLGIDEAGSKFRYLKNKFTRLDRDRMGYNDLRVALRMSRLNIRSTHLFQVVLAVLHLGNIEFEEENTNQGLVSIIKDNKDKENKNKNNKKRNKINQQRYGSKSSIRSRFDSSNSRNVRRKRFSTIGSVLSSESGVSRTPTVGTVIKVDRKDDYSPLKHTARLLNVRKSLLIKMLTTKVINLPNKKVEKRLDIVTASKRRDAIAKHIYGLLFGWLVSRMNVSLHNDPHEENENLTSFIGILDIFGFEEFEKNSFEQLLINYTNEVLLSLFVKEILIGESEIYRQEGLVLQEGELSGILETTKAYEDCLNLFEGYKNEEKKLNNIGLLKLMVNQQRIPKINDKTLLTTMHKTFKDSSCFLKVHPSMKDKCFIIKHYASEVMYDIQGFLNKNDQSLPSDIENLFKASKHRIVREFPFVVLDERQKDKQNESEQQDQQLTEIKRNKESKVSFNFRKDNKKQIKKTKNVRRKRNKNNKKNKTPTTVCGTFSRQISSLKKTLDQTMCSYIRCIKPNPTLFPPYQSIKGYIPGEKEDGRLEKMMNMTKSKFSKTQKLNNRKITFSSSKRKFIARKYFEDEYVSQQLKNLGVFECVNVLKAGLPTRIPYPSFMLTFNSAVPMEDLVFYKNRSMDFRRRIYVAALMKIFDVDPQTYKLGKTKIFFRSGQLEEIKNILEKGLQGMQGRSGKMKKRLMRKFNKFYCRRLWRVGIAKTRAILYFKRDLLKIRAVLKIQKAYKIYYIKKKKKLELKKRKAIILIQKIWRGHYVRKTVVVERVNNLRTEFKDKDKRKVQGSKAKSELDVELYDQMSESGVHPMEGDTDFQSAFSSAGGYNTLRGTLQSYFNRRTNINRRTLGGSVAGINTEMRQRSSKRIGKESFFSKANRLGDQNWGDKTEDDFRTFDGNDYKKEMDTINESDMNQVDSDSNSDSDSFSKVSLIDHDTQSEIEQPSDVENSVLGEELEPTQNRRTFRSDKSSTRSVFDGMLSEDPQLASLITRDRRKRSTGISKNRKTRASQRKTSIKRTSSHATGELVTKQDSDEMGLLTKDGEDYLNNSRKRLTQVAEGFLKGTQIAEEKKVDKEKEEALSIKPVSNRLALPSTWAKEGQKQPPWKVKLRKVERKIKRMDSNDSSKNSLVDPSADKGQGFALRMAELFGGSKKFNNKKKP